MDEQNISGKKNIDKKKLKKITITVLVCCVILIIGVAITSTVLGERLSGMSDKDSDVIAIIPNGDVEDNQTDEAGDISNNDTNSEENGSEDGRHNTENENSGSNNGSNNDDSNVTVHTNQYTGMGDKQFGFEASDGTQVWTTETKVEIFRLSYDNGSGDMTVVSSNGDKLIAPGTEGSYTFKFKNTGNAPIEYDMDVDVVLEPSGIELPITFKLNRYDGSYLAGGEDSWVEAEELQGLEDGAKLAKNRYAYYTLEWKWPFENGNDDYDTWLGNLSLEEDISLSMKITTVATGDESVVSGNVKTGDNANFVMYILLLGGSALIIFIIIFFRRRRDEEEIDEA